MRIRFQHLAPLLLLSAACGSTPAVTADAGADASPDASPPSFGASVLQHHNSAARTGVYIDTAFTRDAAKALHVDPTFTAKISGPTYGQPLTLK